MEAIQASAGAFAALLRAGACGSTVQCWGDPAAGGDARNVQEQLRNVQQIQAEGRFVMGISGLWLCQNDSKYRYTLW